MTGSARHGGPGGLVDILGLFRAGVPLTRAEVMRRAGLSRSTANQRIDALLAAHLVVPADAEASTGGRPAGLFTFNTARGVLLVADIGATGVRIALCNLGGRILAEAEETIDVAQGPTTVLTTVSKHFSALLAPAGLQPADVLGIGLDVPGPVDFASGRVVSPPIMTGWDRYDIPGWFAAEFRCPVLVDKDANAMALGEQRRYFRDVSHMMMLKVGTGVGSGLIINGAIHRGADGAAGDIGHIQLSPADADSDEPLCRCGNTGCVEAHAGGWALVRDLRAAGKQVESVDGVVACVQAGDITAQQLLRHAGRVLGRAVADAVNLFNPRVIAVCGQLARTDEQLLAGMREVVYRRSLPLATRNLQIVRSRLDARAGVAGMSVLLADEILSPPRVDALLGTADS